MSLPQIMHPSIEQLERRAAFMKKIREFFDSRDFLEVDTPLLVDEVGFEPNLIPFETTDMQFHGKETRKFLITSPELWMKRLLAAGAERIYQISSCFRNAEVPSPLHRPEFKMIEWYRRDANYLDIINDFHSLFEYLELPKLKVMTMHEAFAHFTDCNLAELEAQYTDKTAFEEAFFKIFLTEVEPKLDAHVLIDYPASMASLSVVQGQIAERFEVYLNGVELANGFSELVDPTEQEKRCRADLAERIKNNQKKLPYPEKFIESLEKIPSAAGVALGIDRLFMLYNGDTEIDQWS